MLGDRGCPELSGRGRHDRLGDVDEAADQSSGPSAERPLGPLRGAEEVGDEGNVRVAHSGEQERGSPGGDDPAVDLGGLEPRIDLGLDDGEVSAAAQPIEERPEVGKGRGAGH